MRNCFAPMLRGGFFLGAALLSAAAYGDAPQARIDRVSPPDQNFFSKKTFAEKIPIEAHADVPDAALRAGAERISLMLAHAPRIAANLRARSFEMEIAGKLQLISDLPPFHELHGTIFRTDAISTRTRAAPDTSGSNTCPAPKEISSATRTTFATSTTSASTSSRIR